MTKYFDVGNIVNTHGIKGEVRVISITTHPEERYFSGSSLVWFGENNEQISLEVESHRIHKQFDLLKFKEFSSINEVEKLVGGMLKVSEKYLLDDLDKNEFYLHEVIGLDVVDESENHIGRVKEILSPGANDVWVVSRKGEEDLLLPYIDSVVLNVDLENKQVLIHFMEGLDD